MNKTLMQFTVAICGGAQAVLWLRIFPGTWWVLVPVMIGSIVIGIIGGELIVRFGDETKKT